MAAPPLELETPQGPARAHLHPVAGARAAIVLGHGAGGSITARDLVAVAGVARSAGVAAALIEQPYRVAGKRSSPPPRHLDAAWVAVVEGLRSGPLAGLPLVVGGRSAGARVACRTAAATDALAVLCLAFPLQPPARRSGAESPSRQAELDGVGVPTLVVQGAGDRFGVPGPGPSRRVVVVPGDHRLVGDLGALGAAVAAWLGEVVAS